MLYTALSILDCIIAAMLLPSYRFPLLERRMIIKTSSFLMKHGMPAIASLTLAALTSSGISLSVACLTTAGYFSDATRSIILFSWAPLPGTAVTALTASRFLTWLIRLLLNVRLRVSGTSGPLPHRKWRAGGNGAVTRLQNYFKRGFLEKTERREKYGTEGDRVVVWPLLLSVPLVSPSFSTFGDDQAL